jgi:hypothetical protein
MQYNTLSYYIIHTAAAASGGLGMEDLSIIHTKGNEDLGGE